MGKLVADNKSSDTPPDSLRYYDMEQGGDDKWYFQNFYGTSDLWYIGEVQSLGRMIPEPATLALMFSAVAGAAVVIRRRKSQ